MSITFNKEIIQIIVGKLIDVMIDRISEITAYKVSRLNGMIMKPGDTINMQYAVEIPYDQLQDMLISDKKIILGPDNFRPERISLNPDEINLSPPVIKH